MQIRALYDRFCAEISSYFLFHTNTFFKKYRIQIKSAALQTKNFGGTNFGFNIFVANDSSEAFPDFGGILGEKYKIEDISPNYKIRPIKP